MIEIHQLTVILIAAFSLIIGLIAGGNIRLLRNNRIKASDIIDPNVNNAFTNLNKEIKKSIELMEEIKKKPKR